MHHPSCLPIEVLESRIAPAGLVLVTFDEASGLLTLGGDIADNLVQVSNTGKNTYRIEGIAGTDIGTVGNSITDIEGNLKTIVINAGPGSDNFTLSNLQKLTSVTFNGDTGNDALSAFNLKTKADVTANLGADGGTATFDGTTSIGGALTVNYGDGGGATTILGTTATIKKAVTLNGGAGADSFTLSADSATLGKGVTFIAGAGANQATFSGASATIGKGATGNALEFTGGPDNNRLEILGATMNLKAGLLFTSGAGADTVNLNAATLKVGGALTVTAGDGTDTVELLAGTATIKGDVNIALGNGVSNRVEFRPGVSLTLSKSLTLSGGTLDDSFLFTGNSTVSIKGAVSMDVGDGALLDNNTVALDSTTLTLGKSLTITGAPASSVSVSSDAAILTVKGLVDITTGLGDSMVQILANQATLGSLVVKTSSGAELVQFLGSKLTVKGGLSVETGAGVDFVDFGFDTVDIKGSVAIKTGDQADGVTFFSDGKVKGNFEIDLGAADDGSSSADLASNSGIAGNLKISGALTISSATTDTGLLGNTETVTVKELTVSKAILINLGVVDSALAIDNLFAKNTLTINTGDGLDVVNIEQAGLFGPSVFSKVVAINLGAGNDTFRAGISSADGSSSFVRFLDDTTVDGGADTDASNDFLNPATNSIDSGATTTRANFEGPFI